ncbi:pyridoxamine 5'-phosphate oxidase family protein [Ruminococcus sp. 5_1_39BFAA]|uniref:pyridoxamine 5'-phosphate oxidase family protein n=1 Tax=Ruminococcus sp. 5_1_39BFAA TaxID=457412 RepID=UPI003564485D
MRRSDREVTDRNEMIQIMEKCDVCRLVLNDEGYPYIVPLNFGMLVKEDRLELYFHGAAEGKKYDLIARDNRATFEMDCEHLLVLDEEKGNCTMNYESVIGRGFVEMVPDDEKYEGLCILMNHYREEGFPFSQKAIPRTNVFKLVVTEMTGKIRTKKKK